MNETYRCICKMRMPVVMRDRGNKERTVISRVVTFRCPDGSLKDMPVNTDKAWDTYEIGKDYTLAL